MGYCPKGLHSKFVGLIVPGRAWRITFGLVHRRLQLLPPWPPHLAQPFVHVKHSVKLLQDVYQFVKLRQDVLVAHDAATEVKYPLLRACRITHSCTRTSDV